MADVLFMGVIWRYNKTMSGQVVVVGGVMLRQVAAGLKSIS